MRNIDWTFVKTWSVGGSFARVLNTCTLQNSFCASYDIAESIDTAEGIQQK